MLISANRYFHSDDVGSIVGDTTEAAMTIQTGWDNDDLTVIRTALHDHWTWETLYGVNNDVIDMMRGVDHSVHLLLDCTESDTIPAGGVIMHMRNLLGAYPPNCDLRIVITHNVLVERLMNIFQAAFQTGLGKQVYTVSSVEEAYDVIQKHMRLQAEVH